MTLRRKQDLCLDAIEHSFSMAEISYARIIGHCRAQHLKDASSEDDRVVLDAWSFVDVVKRLRTVLVNTPGLKSSGVLKQFLSTTDAIPNFRHHIQHIEEKVAAVAQSGRPIWGSFSWVVLAEDRDQFAIVAYVPGRLAVTKGIPVVNPAGREFHDDIDHFEMSLEGATLNISEISRTVKVLGAQFTFLALALFYFGIIIDIFAPWQM